MGYARHIGRVGALAVALGVSAAVATTPGIAYAEPDDAGAASSSTGDSSSTGSAPATGGTAASAGGAASDDGGGAVAAGSEGTHPSTSSGESTSGSAGASSPTAADDSAAGGEIDADDVGDPTPEPAGGGAGDEEETLPTGDEDLPAGTGGHDTTPTGTPSTQAGDVATATVSSGSADHHGATQQAADSSAPSVAPPDSSDDVGSPLTADAIDVPAAAAAVTASSEAVVQQVQSNTAAPAPAPFSLALPPIWELPGAVVSMASQLVSAVLGPMLGPGSGTGTQSPMLWAVLGWVRRQFEQVIAPPGTTAQTQLVVVQLEDPTDVSKPVPLNVDNPTGLPLSYQVAGQGEAGGPAHGTVTIDPATGAFVYNPDDSFAQTGGTDTFTVTVRNDFGFLSFLSPTRTITVTVNMLPTSPDAPYFTNQQLHDYLLSLAQQQYQGLFGQTLPQYEYGGPWWYDRVYAVSGASSDGGIVSGTNTQVDGIDEADFVETDGNMIYVVRNGQVTILDHDMNVMSQVAVSGNVAGAFLSGDRLTVITQSGWGGWYGPYVRLAYPGPWYNPNPKTTVTVYDVSDAAAPTIAGQTVFDGVYHDARAIDGTVYLVLDTSFKLPEVHYTETPAGNGDPVPWDPGDISILKAAAGEVGDTGTDILAIPRWGWQPTITSYRTYETWDEYVARVGDDIVNLSVPHTYSIDANGNTVDLGPLLSAGNIVRPHEEGESSLVAVVSIDSAHPSTGSGFAHSVASVVPSTGGTVYMTHDALYIGTAEGHYSDTSYSTDTRIDRFIIDGTDLAWQASGVVQGTLINQFAMDEQDGYLHVATHISGSQWVPDGSGSSVPGSTGGKWKSINENAVYVLDTQGKVLEQVGSLTGLAPGEQLFAARFIGDKAYLVTFLQIDPLFVIDLSDPTNPTLQGELEIPGFSNYLQQVGDGLLFGIGQERGNGSNRVQVSLFDVSDGTDPTQIDRLFLDEAGQWSWSEAQFDHHAVLYSPEDGLLVLPFASSGYDAQTGAYHYDQLLKVLHVDADGIESIGEIHTDEPVIRTVRIGNVLYAVSDTSVTAYNLDDLSVISKVSLSGSGQAG